MNEELKPSRVSAIKVVIALMPALLIVAICVALYLAANQEEDEAVVLEGEITPDEMVDYLMKLERMVGERSLATEEGRRGIRQVEAMTEGTLGGLNLGYRVEQVQADRAEGLLWRTMWVDAGKEGGKEVVVLAIPLTGVADGVAFGYGFAEFLTSREVASKVRMVYYPPFEAADEADFERWIWERVGGGGETLRGVIRLAGGGPAEEWASVATPSRWAERVGGLVGRREWEGRVAMEGGASEVMEVRVWDGPMDRERRAGRLINLMSFVQDLVEEVGKG